ncbi:MAG: toll/interleukin-1 receptor domain-containing protein [Chromatiaceae bacterium]|nr:toll/interleukin-1 receptor domain-containing protein [Gammaproteobacteria bacterium]MCP5304898.1 toll/interleukin-1 receptor domain-containing protein [Chromatiaceae bacterium]MCP5314857.1 toll/interleukin-1 receptor domain-containing protein [Chromatiaceae bacterium]
MKIFISYRRSDSQDVAARLADRLIDTSGIRDVFIDVEDIEAGADFEQAIDSAVTQSDACLILIGSDWVGVDPDTGEPRIHQAEDFVRREVRSALRHCGRVIPLLLNGAPMPDPDSLPEDIRPLCSKQAVALRHVSFNQDLSVLVDALFERRPGGSLRRWLRRNPLLGVVFKALGGMLSAAALLIAVGALHSAITEGRALEETLGSRGLVWLVILTTLGIGALLPFWIRRWRH